MTKLTILAALAVAGCAGAMNVQAPSTWTAEQRILVQDLPDLGPMGFCALAARAKSTPATFSTTDRAAVTAELRRRGYSGRDLELLTDPAANFGTGMTFRGLSCAIGYEPRINDAFYPGIGHQWQAVTPGSYVYLEGDGTKAGMRVKAWN